MRRVRLRFSLAIPTSLGWPPWQATPRDPGVPQRAAPLPGCTRERVGGDPPDDQVDLVGEPASGHRVQPLVPVAEFDLQVLLPPHWNIPFSVSARSSSASCTCAFATCTEPVSSTRRMPVRQHGQITVIPAATSAKTTHTGYPHLGQGTSMGCPMRSRPELAISVSRSVEPSKALAYCD